MDPARANGVEYVLVYPFGPFEKEVQRALTGAIRAAFDGEGPDVIYAPVGSKYAEPTLRSIMRGGRYLIAGIPAIPINLPLFEQCHICGVFSGSHIENSPDATVRW